MAHRYRFDNEVAVAITTYSSQLASAVHLASGNGETHVYAVHFEAGGEIGEHVAGFDQLFVVVEGSGWVKAGPHVHAVGVGDVVRLERGESHAKGSETGMSAIMVQIFDMNPET